MILFKKIFPIVLLMGFHLAIGQAVEKKAKNKRYKVWVYSAAGESIVEGVLYQLLDSSVIIISNVIKGTKDQETEVLSKEIKYDQIHEIRFRSLGDRKVFRGILLGGLIGFGAGGLGGLISGGDPPCAPNSWCLFHFSAADYALIYGTLLAVPGTIIGGIVGGLKKQRILFEGKWGAFNAQQASLEALIIPSL